MRNICWHPGKFVLIDEHNQGEISAEFIDITCNHLVSIFYKGAGLAKWEAVNATDPRT